MQSNGYQLLALAARAIFALLAGLVALRAAGMLLREHRARKRLLRTLPDAGMVGEMRDEESDRGYPLPREGTLGGGRGCDIRLRGLKRRQVDFAYVDGKGILLTPCHRRSDTLLDGEPIHRGAYALHGAVLRVGGYTLRIRLFAGLNVPHPAQYQQQRWQPVYEEELYGCEPTPPHAPQPGYAPYPPQAGAACEAPPQWMNTQPIPVTRPLPEEQEAPLPFGQAEEDVQGDEEMGPAWIPAPPVPPAYPETEEEQDAPPPFEMPARHRRSDRRREE